MLKGGAPTKDLLEDNREGYQEKNFSTLPIMTQEEKGEMLDLIRLAIRKEVGVEKLLTGKEASKRLGVSFNTFKKMAIQGQKIGKRVYYRLSDLC